MTIWMEQVVEADSQDALSKEIADMKMFMGKAPLAFFEAAPNVELQVKVVPYSVAN